MLVNKVILGDVCEKIGSGATPRGGSDVYLPQGKVALIRSQNVYNDGFKNEGLVYITDAHAKELDNVAVESNDVLLNITGDSVARCCQVPDDILPARVNQHVAIIRPQKDKLDSRYLRYYLIDPTMQNYMLMLAGGGATRNALTKGMIESFEIPLPPLPEQRAIAGILGALDDKIELNRRMNRTLESIARAVFRQWFVESEEVGSWKVGKLGDVAENIRRGANADEINPDTNYIGLEHMPKGSIALSEWGNASDLASNKFVFKTGEFLFGKLRPYFHKVGIAPIDGVCSTDILVIAPKSPEWYGFVLEHISSVELINYTNAASTGTKMPRTSWSDIANYEVALPPLEKAKEFTKIFLPMAQKIRANIIESRTLASLRDSLLPKLMRGEVRVRG
jgi:type I restriction enzyme S subunit